MLTKRFGCLSVEQIFVKRVAQRFPGVGAVNGSRVVVSPGLEAVQGRGQRTVWAMLRSSTGAGRGSNFFVSAIRGGWGWVGQAGSKAQAHLQAAGHRLVSHAVQFSRRVVRMPLRVCDSPSARPCGVGGTTVLPCVFTQSCECVFEITCPPRRGHHLPAHVPAPPPRAQARTHRVRLAWSSGSVPGSRKRGRPSLSGVCCSALPSSPAAC